MALVITDNTSYVTFESSATEEQRYHIPKNAVILDRNGNKFVLQNGGDNKMPLQKFDFDTAITIGGVAITTADLLESGLLAILYQ